jgi:putative ABC transport system permease protein
MLKLTNIVKEYVTGDSMVSALKGINIEFRESEFVSILGHSGCGKTTLLNIIGGLDHYTDGDLFINGISTKKYKDADWDNYRNHSIGFVFQSYNLIPHQSVLSNVELALTLSGVSKSERRQRAKDALEKVGLADQLHKKPNQMSGGQMQRVAIARALVNNPEILLADEPTGALDTETSKQIMDLLQEIAKDKLVIMVTHNPELAEEYSGRIIRLIDGEIVSDSNPYTAEVTEVLPEKPKKDKKSKKKSMSFLTALSLSMNNLLTKKTRTILSSFAGSIGIIGIALILALSNGIQIYIDRIQEETLASYPLTINAKSEDMTETILGLMSSNAEKSDHELDAVYSSPVLNELINSMTNPKYT